MNLYWFIWSIFFELWFGMHHYVRSILTHVLVKCSVLSIYVLVKCSIFKYVFVKCSILTHVSVKCSIFTCYSEMQYSYTLVKCSILYYVLVKCSILTHVLVRCLNHRLPGPISTVLIVLTATVCSKCLLIIHNNGHNNVDNIRKTLL